KAIGAERVVGGVVYSANAVVAPGVVQNHTPGRNMLTIGAADDRASQGILSLRKALTQAGMHSPDCADIRQAPCSQLLLNLSSSASVASPAWPRPRSTCWSRWWRTKRPPRASTSPEKAEFFTSLRFNIFPARERRSACAAAPALKSPGGETWPGQGRPKNRRSR